ncbi:MAG: hypothetical protein JWM71_999, partial [Solirubrobacteraceae bacterium]|nr:hypothetical protein [Solirubrobacteraceae bacterium]
AALLVGAVAAFTLRAEAALLLVLVVSFRASPVVELLTLAGGALALLAGARRLPGAVVSLPLLALVVFAVWRLPLAPSAADITQPLTLPFVKIEFIPAPSEALLSWWRFGYAAIVFCLAAWVVRDVAGLRRLTTAILVGAVVPVALGLKQIATADFTVRDGFKAIQGQFDFPNYYAFYLLGVILIGVASFSHTRSARWRTVLGLLLVGALVCLFFTYTRSSWLGLVLGFVIYALLRERWWLLVLAGAVALTIFLVPSSLGRVQGRFAGVTDAQPALETNSWTWRTGQWDRMIHFGLDHPVAGSGFRSYERLTVQEFGTLNTHYGTVKVAHGQRVVHGFSAHNDYMRMFVELGAIGLGLWLLTLGGMLRMAISLRRIPGAQPFAIAGMALVGAFMLVSVADNLIGYTVALLIPMALVGGLAGVARSRSRS